MNGKSLRIGFMGTPDFALEALKALVNAGHNVVCVYSQPPRPKGRGHKLTASPVQSFAENQDIPVYHPKSLKSEDVQAEFKAHNLDIAVVAAYGLLLPKAVLAAPKMGCINIHASLLPRWRGASPIHRAILAGDAQSGVTIMQMDEGLDTGPEIMKKSLDIAPRETSATLHDKLAALGADMIIQALNTLAKNGQISNIKQKKEGITYAHLLKKDDGKIDWTHSAEQIDRQIRALNPWPGVWCETQGVRFKIIEAQPTNDIQNGEVGAILNKDGEVLCGDKTTLKLIRVQPAGKQAMDFASALNGGYLKIGQIFK